jgi:hypothetical protein
MTTLKAEIQNKFDPDKDEHRPKVGDTIRDGKLEIMDVEYISATDLLKEFAREDFAPDFKGHDDLLVFDHPDRPFVKYKVWVKKITEDEKH